MVSNLPGLGEFSRVCVNSHGWACIDRVCHMCYTETVPDNSGKLFSMEVR